MAQDTIYGVAVADPAKSICDAWRSEFLAARKAQTVFALSMGASQMRHIEIWGGARTSLGLVLPAGKLTADWTKPDRHGVSRLKKTADKALREAVDALPALPSKTDLAKALGVESHLNWSRGESWGGSGVGPFFDPVNPHWGSLSGPVILCMADVSSAARRRLEENPETTFEGDPLNWKPMDGIRVVTEHEAKAQFHLDAAQAERVA